MEFAQVAGRVIPIYGSSAPLYKLLSGLLGRRGCMPLPVEGIFDLMDLAYRLTPKVAFVCLEELIEWNQDGLARLRSSTIFAQTAVVPFSEKWRREELPAIPGLEAEDILFVPFSVSDLESILERHTPAIAEDPPDCDRLAI